MQVCIHHKWADSLYDLCICFTYCELSERSLSTFELLCATNAVLDRWVAPCYRPQPDNNLRGVPWLRVCDVSDVSVIPTRERDGLAE